MNTRFRLPFSSGAVLFTLCTILFSESSVAQIVVSYTGPAVSIPDANPAGVNINLTVVGVGAINDLNFRFDTSGACDSTVGNTNSAVNHTFVGDLTFKLTSPAGTSRTFMARRGGTRENICLTTIDDEGGFPNISTLTSVTGSPVTGNFSPETTGTLSGFDGENPNGTWVLNVSDNAGNDTGSLRRFSLIFGTCSMTCPANVTVSAAANACTSTVTYPAPTTLGTCGAVTCSPPSGSTFPKGATAVQCQSSVGGASCAFNVTVKDTTPPSITCPANITVSTNNPAGATVPYLPAVATDACGAPAIVCSPLSSTTFPVGTTTVNCSAADSSANTATCSFSATVQLLATPTPTSTATFAPTATPTVAPTATLTAVPAATPTVASTPGITNVNGEKPICTTGPRVAPATFIVNNIGGASGDETLSLRGKVRFNKRTFDLIDSRTNGAQIEVLDMGNNNTPIFELSQRTSVISGGALGAVGACSAQDGWVAKNRYTNASNKLGGLLCAEGSANGVASLSLSKRDKRNGLSSIAFSTRSTTLFQPGVTGPMKGTVIFGSNAQGAVGHCATISFRKAQCTKNKSQSRLTCRVR